MSEDNLERIIERGAQFRLNHFRPFYSEAEVLVRSLLNNADKFNELSALVVSKLSNKLIDEKKIKIAITPEEFDVLMAVKDYSEQNSEGKLTQQMIAQHMAIHRNSAYRLIDNLTKDEKQYLTLKKVGRNVYVGLTPLGKTVSSLASEYFYFEAMLPLVEKVRDIDVQDMKVFLNVLDKIENGFREVEKVVDESKQVTGKNDQLMEFYGVVYSEKFKVLALTGKRTFIKYSPEQIARDFRNWNQAQSKDQNFKNMADDKDNLKAIKFVNSPESEIAMVIKSFFDKGYKTSSQIKPFIRRVL